LPKHDVAQDLHAVEGFLTLIALLLRSALALFRSHGRQAIVEHFAVRDDLGMFRQLGHLSSLGA